MNPCCRSAISRSPTPIRLPPICGLLYPRERGFLDAQRKYFVLVDCVLQLIQVAVALLSGQESGDRQQGNELGLLVFLFKIIVPILPNQIFGQSRTFRHGAHPQPLVVKQEVSGDAETFNGGTEIFSP